MWDWLSKTGDFFKNNADALKGLGLITSGVGSAYSTYKQGKAADKTYNLNLDILKEEKRRRDKAQKELEDGYFASTYNTK